MILGTPLSSNATKILLLGSGELGKEFIIECQRLGIECIAVDSYQNAPAMQVAHRSYVIDMKDKEALKYVLEREVPDFIVPEIEAINTDMLIEIEEFGYTVVPKAFATKLTMDREGIRRLASEQLNIPTAKYQFATTLEELKEAVNNVGTPCIVKPIMSSSGKGQSKINNNSNEEIEKAWNYANEGARGKGNKVIIEEFINFDYEITLLTARCNGNTYFCPPIGHIQKNGDYIESWQPHPLSNEMLEKAQEIAKKITTVLGGNGLFGVELFVKGNEIIFNEVSPRPHDTGMVTMVTQNINEFEIHLRCILGMPIDIKLLNYGASAVIKSNIYKYSPQYDISQAVNVPDTKIRLFGKPLAKIGRRMGVALATGSSIEEAREKAKKCANSVVIK